jgi:tetratricopeptide (TPR) repeat protein
LNRKKTHWYQKLIESYLPWIFAGFMFIGSVLDTISNSIQLMTLPVAIFGTITVLLGYISISFFLRKRPLHWRFGSGGEIRIKGLGIQSIFVLTGIVLAFWIPNLISFNNSLPSIPWLYRAKENEILIMIADFENQSSSSYDISGAILLDLEEEVEKYDLSEVKILKINESFKRTESDFVINLGKKYNATIIIWGHYDDAGIYPRITLSDSNTIEYSPEQPGDKYINLGSPPNDLSLYINRELPDQFRFMTQFVIGQIYYQKRDAEKSVNILSRVIELGLQFKNMRFNRSLAVAYHYRAFVYYEAYLNYDNAISDLTVAINLDGENIDFYINRGAIYEKSGDFEKALIDFEQAYSLNSNNLLANYDLGYVNYKLGNYDVALSLLTDAIALDKEFDASYTSRGLVYYYLGELELAIVDFSKAISLNEANFMALNNRGIVYNQLGEINLSLSDYNAAIDANPDFLPTYGNRAFLYKEIGEYDKAIKDYGTMISKNIFSVYAFFNRGLAYFESSEYELAIQDFTRVIFLEEIAAIADLYYAPSAWNYRGFSYVQQGDYEPAIADFEHILEYFPNIEDEERDCLKDNLELLESNMVNPSLLNLCK